MIYVQLINDLAFMSARRQTYENLSGAIDGSIVHSSVSFDSRLHHHSSSDSINWIGNNTGTSLDSKPNTKIISDFNRGNFGVAKSAFCEAYIIFYAWNEIFS